jgi:hypothetical protein
MKNLTEYYSFPFLNTTNEDTAFMSNAMPCNPLPFLTRMQQIIKENGTDATISHQFRANLLIVMQQTFGQISTIDLCDLWESLNTDYKIGMF